MHVEETIQMRFVNRGSFFKATLFASSTDDRALSLIACRPAAEGRTRFIRLSSAGDVLLRDSIFDGTTLRSAQRHLKKGELSRPRPRSRVSLGLLLTGEGTAS